MNEKKSVFWAAVLLLLLTPGLAQVAETGRPHDLKQVRYELEIMEGILQKTLSFASTGGRRTRHNVFYEGNIHSFYLHGQGALFMVRVPLLRGELASRLAEMEMVFDDELEGQLARLEDVDMERAQAALRAAERHMRSAQRQMEREIRHLYDSLGSEGVGYSVAPLPPRPPDVPEPPPPPPGSERPVTPETEAQIAARKARLQEEVTKMRARLEEEKKVLEQKQAELDEQLDQVKEALVEALARHGDSLSVVSDDEHVTLILDGGERVWFPDGRRGDGASIISVKKSDILAFSRGQINLAEFKSRARNYRN